LKKEEDHSGDLAMHPFAWAGREVLNGVEETPTVFISIKETFQ